MDFNQYFNSDNESAGPAQATENEAARLMREAIEKAYGEDKEIDHAQAKKLIAEKYPDFMEDFMVGRSEKLSEVIAKAAQEYLSKGGKRVHPTEIVFANLTNSGDMMRQYIQIATGGNDMVIQSVLFESMQFANQLGDFIESTIPEEGLGIEEEIPRLLGALSICAMLTTSLTEMLHTAHVMNEKGNEI